MQIPARFYRLIPVLVLLFCLCVSKGNPAEARSYKPNPRYASIIIDASTGLVLHQRNPDKVLHPASLTKIMTLLLTFEAIEDGHLRLNDRVRVSRHAASMVPSKLDLPVGSSIRLEDAISAIVTKSANDIAVVLAEAVAGSEKAFAVKMTRKAHEIGMTRTVFKNASGLHNSGQVSTARDMARLAQYLIQKYPDYYGYFSRDHFSYNGKSYRNHNRLMSRYSGMDGIKTGYVQASGFNLVSSVERDGTRLIGVVFGGRTAKTRDAHMEKLLDRGFSTLRKVRVASFEQPPIPPTKPSFETVVALAETTDQTASDGMDDADDMEENSTPDPKWLLSLLNPGLSDNRFGLLLGEGDYDPAEIKRIETSLVAISAHSGRSREDLPLPPRTATSVGFSQFKNLITSRPLTPQEKAAFDARRLSVRNAPPSPEWSVQIGAYKSRDAGDQILRDVVQKLPNSFLKARPVVVPLRTENGWIYRARLIGFDKGEAEQICKYLSQDCVAIAPKPLRGS